jgi:hypothetical protein
MLDMHQSVCLFAADKNKTTFATHKEISRTRPACLAHFALLHIVQHFFFMIKWCTFSLEGVPCVILRRTLTGTNHHHQFIGQQRKNVNSLCHFHDAINFGMEISYVYNSNTSTSNLFTILDLCTTMMILSKMTF